jgi:hypothetical protein
MFSQNCASMSAHHVIEMHKQIKFKKMYPHCKLHHIRIKKYINFLSINLSLLVRLLLEDGITILIIKECLY